MAELSEGLFLLKRKSGDGVLFGKWSGTGVKIDGEDLLIMKEADVMGRDRKVHPHSR